MRINYVLVDHENVGLESVELLKNEVFRLVVFVGALQPRIAFETAAAIQQLGQRAEYVKISGSGKNALDFHLAFYLGRLANQDPTGYFHLISNDKGFDPLVAHLTEQSVQVARRSAIADIPLIRASSATNAEGRAKLFAERLAKPGATHPKKMQTLSSAINALFSKQLSQEEVLAVIEQLVRLGKIAVNEQTKAVTYSA